MKWHDHPLLARTGALAAGASPRLPTHRMAGGVQKMITRNGIDRGVQNALVQLAIEAAWVKADRPYYDLYPSVAEAFLKVDLNKVTCGQLHLPLPELMVRLPVGKELELSPTFKMRSLLIGESRAEEGGRGWLISINNGDTIDGTNKQPVVVHTVTGVRMVDGDTIEQHLKQGRDKPYAPNDPTDNEAIDNAFRLVVTLCLLKDDPDLIAPLPLDADKERWEATHDPALLAKAARRGKRAWAVGRDIEVAPGFRRPHFAIRWCGKGRVDPRLRPIKGCLVHRKIVQEVPTDWLGEFAR